MLYFLQSLCNDLEQDRTRLSSYRSLVHLLSPIPNLIRGAGIIGERKSLGENPSRKD